MTTRAEIEGLRAGLDALHARIAGRFRRSEARERAKRYLAALLDRVDRKNGWQLAEHLGESGPQGVQRLLNAADWDADAVRDDLRAYVIEHLGEPDGVLVIDETGFLKKGTKSVGVQRQYCGTAGRIENCQIGVFLGYASAAGHAFIDRALYLPEGWVEDTARRREAGVPETVTFATKPELAKTMLQRAFAADVPATWVVGDEVYGNDPGLRRWLEAEKRAYVLAVSANHPLWQHGERVRADVVVRALPQEAWATHSAGAGSQGERLYDWAMIRLPDEDSGERGSWLLARRSRHEPLEFAYYRAFGPRETRLEELAHVAGMRWTIEVCFEDAKDVVGLDHYEVRKWIAWYRHITLALLAHAYLEVTRRAAEAGQKGGRRPPPSDGSRSPSPPAHPHRATRTVRHPARMV
jgi:SRSO17 transposase